jgi:DNA-binding CsgD family transcriptional regulator
VADEKQGLVVSRRSNRSNAGPAGVSTQTDVVGRRRGNLRNPILNAIQTIYDATLDETRWQDVASAVAAAFGRSSCMIGVRILPHAALRPISATANYTSKKVKTYTDYYWKQDLFIHPAMAATIDNPLLSQAVVRPETFAKSEFYEDWCREADICHLITATFQVLDGARAFVGVHAPRKSERFGDADKVFLGQIGPHLQRALQIRHRLSPDGAPNGNSRLALSGLNSAAMIVGRDARLIYATPKAEKLIREAEAIKVEGNQVHLVNASGAVLFDRCIEAAIDTAEGHGSKSGGILLAPRAGKRPLSVIVAPMRDWDIPRAIVLLRDPDELVSYDMELQRLYGLTPTEADIVGDLINGRSVQSIGQMNRVSTNTLRTQLKSIFAKTGTKRQAELVSLVLRSLTP